MARGLATLAALLSVLACAPALAQVPPAPVAPAQLTPAQVTPAQVTPAQPKPAGPAEQISAFRLQHGEGRVMLDPVLTAIAHDQAAAMAAKDVLDHDVLGPFGSRTAKAKAGFAAENIAYGYDSFPKTLEQWINSSGHRKNLLMHDATKVGIASARSAASKRTYWAMVIAGGYERPAAKQAKAKPESAAKAVSADKPVRPKAKKECGMRVLGVCLY
jgi:uncharacterized protein YkwD